MKKEASREKHKRVLEEYGDVLAEQWDDCRSFFSSLVSQNLPKATVVQLYIHHVFEVSRRRLISPSALEFLTADPHTATYLYDSILRGRLIDPATRPEVFEFDESTETPPRTAQFYLRANPSAPDHSLSCAQEYLKRSSQDLCRTRFIVEAAEKEIADLEPVVQDLYIGMTIGTTPAGRLKDDQSSASTYSRILSRTKIDNGFLPWRFKALTMTMLGDDDMSTHQYFCLNPVASDVERGLIAVLGPVLWNSAYGGYASGHLSITKEHQALIDKVTHLSSPALATLSLTRHLIGTRNASPICLDNPIGNSF